MPLLEVCVDSLTALDSAQAGGAARIELCSRLDLEGLSPSPELLAAALRVARVPLVVMVRPSPGDFVARPEDLAAMERELTRLRELPIAAVTLGLLTREGEVDRKAIEFLTKVARPLPVVFHRAFDRARDLPAALETLVELGIPRVLTSGGAATAFEGRAMLRTLVERAAGRITILAGGGIRSHNVEALLAATGIEEIHSSDVRCQPP